MKNTRNEHGIFKPVNSFPNESMVRIVTLDAGREAMSRLCALGLVPGTRVRIFKNGNNGPVKLRFRGSELVLGRGLAEKILVEQVKDD